MAGCCPRWHVLVWLAGIKKAATSSFEPSCWCTGSILLRRSIHETTAVRAAAYEYFEQFPNRRVVSKLTIMTLGDEEQAAAPEPDLLLQCDAFDMLENISPKSAFARGCGARGPREG